MGRHRQIGLCALLITTICCGSSVSSGDLQRQFAKQQQQSAGTNRKDEVEEQDECFMCGGTVVFVLLGLLLFFICYSGLLCMCVPCEWASRTAMLRRIRDLLDHNRPGELRDEHGALLGRYEPTAHEIAAFKQLEEDFQEL
ncbi:uncharacterized protein LOC135941077 [Cloeon dipterum]|uniref:uncharacterized protein LOC135941077 n=1 Tax=Cloeon dipterum TaxID=197152 RepID=UPI00321F81F9